MKVSKSISQSIKETFLVLEKNSILKKPNKFKNFKVIEVEMSGTTVGVGIDSESTELAIFIIKTDFHYEIYDDKKYCQTFTIGIPKNCGRNEYWKLRPNEMNASNGNIQKISKHIAAVAKIYETLLIISNAKVITLSS